MAEIMTPNGLVVGLIIESAPDEIEKEPPAQEKKPATRTGRSPKK